MSRILHDYIQRNRLRMTPQRRLIFDQFLALDRHVTAEELFHLVRRSDPSIGLATVFRVMKILEDSGAAQSSGLGGRQQTYEPLKSSGRGHHAHLVCMSCGKIIEFSNRLIFREQDRVARRAGFHVHQRRLEMHGLCRGCRKSGPESRKA